MWFNFRFLNSSNKRSVKKSWTHNNSNSYKRKEEKKSNKKENSKILQL